MLVWEMLRDLSIQLIIDSLHLKNRFVSDSRADLKVFGPWPQVPSLCFGYV